MCIRDSLYTIAVETDNGTFCIIDDDVFSHEAATVLRMHDLVMDAQLELGIVIESAGTDIEANAVQDSAGSIKDQLFGLQRGDEKEGNEKYGFAAQGYKCHMCFIIFALPAGLPPSGNYSTGPRTYSRTSTQCAGCYS